MSRERDRHGFASVARGPIVRVRRVPLLACTCLGIALLAMASAAPAPEHASGARLGPGERFVAGEIAGHARKAKRRCPRGHVLLALHGPRVIVAGRPERYLLLAHACRRVPSSVRLSVQGPQKIGLRVRRLRAGATVKRRVELRFPPLVNSYSPTFAILTIEAHSSRGKLLGRLRVRVTYREAPPPEPLPPGGVSVGWGDNFRGEVGTGFRSGPLTHPVQGVLRGVREVAAGLNSGFALLTDGTVRAWGANGCGQLGDGSRAESLQPVRVLGLSHVKQIAASGNHVLALLENGTALAWGEDKNGQLGDGATGTKLVPTPVKNLTGVRSVVIGGVASLGGHMLALLGDGQVMVAGQNEHGQLGLGDTQDRHAPVPLPGVANATSVSAGITHSLVALANGAVLSWGTDADGELGYRAPQTCGTAPCSETPHPVPISNASAVAAGNGFSIAVSGGRVLSWGNNEGGQLGNGTTTQSTSPVEVPGITGIATVRASERFTLALVEQGPEPDFVLRSGPGVLIAEWTPAPGGEPWAVTWRVAAHPPLAWGKPVVLPPSAHSYAIAGLGKVRYEVRLTRLNTPSFGRRIAYGTPE
jgi:Regulator of chromosome condensation (RCC1) repeat